MECVEINYPTVIKTSLLGSQPPSDSESDDETTDSKAYTLSTHIDPSIIKTFTKQTSKQKPSQIMKIAEFDEGIQSAFEVFDSEIDFDFSSARDSLGKLTKSSEISPQDFIIACLPSFTVIKIGDIIVAKKFLLKISVVFKLYENIITFKKFIIAATIFLTNNKICKLNYNISDFIEKFNLKNVIFLKISTCGVVF